MKSYSIEEIANEYGITTRKARDWIRRGSIPYKKLPKTRRYVPSITVEDIHYYGSPIINELEKLLSYKEN